MVVLTRRVIRYQKRGRIYGMIKIDKKHIRKEAIVFIQKRRRGSK